MEPGDGKDNNQNGEIDEDDCCKYQCILNTHKFHEELKSLQNVGFYVPI